VAPLRKPGGVSAGPRTDIEHAARNAGDQVKDIRMLFGERNALVSLDELCGCLRIAVGPGDDW
jgi:hypothetical protein